MRNQGSMDSLYPVLIVDDEPSVLSALKRELKAHVPVLTSSDPQEALELLKTRTIAVVISDYKMPGKNGIELLSSLTELPYEPVKILMTAFSELDIAIEAVNKAGIYYFLRKPWNPLELQTLVTRALETFKERNELKYCKQRLVDIDSIKRGITGVLSHELNTPLTTLKGYAALLDGNVKDSDFYNIVHGLKSSVEKLEGFISQTIETANLELADPSQEKTRVKIGKLIARYFDFITVDATLEFDSSPVLIEKALVKLSQYIRGKGNVSGFSELNQEYLFLVININSNKLDAVKPSSFVVPTGMEPTGDIMNYSGTNLDLVYVAAALKATGVSFNILNTDNVLRIEITFSGVKNT